MRSQRIVLVGLTALGFALAAAPPVVASEAGLGTGDCGATASAGNTAGKGWAKTAKDFPAMGTCGVITVQIHEFVVGSPGLYVWLPRKLSAYGASSISQTSTRAVINRSEHWTDYDQIGTPTWQNADVASAILS